MHDLRLFTAVARHHSFSHAAQELGVTQSAVSQRICALEKRLGVRLIDRSVRPLALTAAGEEYLHGCRDLVERYERLQRKISGLQPGLQGQVRVEAIYSAGIDLLVSVKEKFEEKHPRVTLQIEYNRPEEVYLAVQQRQCDLGIVSYPARWRDVGVIPLRDEVMVVVCPPSHPLAGRERVHASELGEWPIVNLEPGLPAARHIKRYLREHGVTPVIEHVFDNMDTIKSAVGVMGELAIMPRRLVRREVDAGTLMAVDLEPEIVRPMGMIHARGEAGRNGRFAPAVQGFVEFLLEHAGSGADEQAVRGEAAKRRLAAGSRT